MARPFLDIGFFGDAELQRNLNKFTEKLQKKIAKKALKKGAEVILHRARALVPVDTGALAGSLKIRAFTSGYKTRRGADLIGVVIEPGTRKELGIAPDDPYYYPAVLEYGGQHGEYRRPMPFLRPAFDSGKAEADRVIAAEIRRGVETTAQGLGDSVRAFGEGLVR